MGLARGESVRDLEEDPVFQENTPLQTKPLVTSSALNEAPMRILVWYWGRRGAGAQIALAMAAALDRRHDTSVCLSISRQSELIDEFRSLQIQTQEVDTYQSLGGFLLGLVRVPQLTSRLVQLARNWQADAVVSIMTHTWTPLVAPGLARANIAFVPIIHDVTPHPGDNNDFLWDWRLRTEMKAARAAFTLSSYAEAGLRQTYTDIPLLRLPLGASFLPAEKMSRRGGLFRFLFFGRLRAYKGLDLLRDAFRLLVARRPEARLIIVGEGDVPALAPGLDAIPGVEVRARWVPEAAIGDVMAGADAVVIPYREASQSGVISAAFVGRLPVVVTPVGGIVEQVMPSVNAIIATAVTPEAFADAMEQMMDPLVHRVLSAGAAQAGRRLSDWDIHAAKLLEGLRTIGLQSSPA